MVSPDVIATVEALTPDERRQLVDYIENLDGPDAGLTEDQQALIRSRAAELQADPSIGLTLDEHLSGVRRHFS